MSFEYDYAKILRFRSGKPGDPYIEISEDHVVDNSGKVFLTELPSEFHGVKVKGDGIQWSEIRRGSPSDNSFKVDYKNASVTFKDVHIGKQLNFSYMGKGLTYVSARSVYTQRDSLTIKETLGSIIDEGRKGIDALYDLNEFVFKGLYDDSYSYKKWNFVLYNNKTYVAKDDIKGELPESSTKWELVGGYSYKDIYQSGNTYHIGDLVSDYNKHNLYMSLKNNNTDNIDNDSSWIKFMSIDHLEESVDVKIQEMDDLITAVSSQEDIRSQNEQVRIDQENQRQDNELIRQLNEQERQDALDQINNLIDNTEFVEKWDPASTYQKNNIVNHNRSSFISLVDENTGNEPDVTKNTSFWGVLTKAGDVSLKEFNNLEANYENHKISNSPHRYGNRYEWRYNPETDTLDLVVL